MNTLPTLNHRDNAIRLLANGYADDFAEFVAGNEKVHDLMAELASEFVNTNIPIVDEDAAEDTAFELVMNITVTKV